MSLDLKLCRPKVSRKKKELNKVKPKFNILRPVSVMV